MRNTEKRRNREAGFTIMELAAVLGIIAILATLSVPTYKSFRRKAYEAEARTFIQEIRVAAWEFRLEKGEWPTNFKELGFTESDTEMYESKYFTYDIEESSGKLKITATGQDAATGITVTGMLDTDGQIEIE